MSGWFIVAIKWVYDPKWGSNVRDTVLWDATTREWNSTTATPFKDPEMAESIAFFLQATLLEPGYDTKVLDFSGVLKHFGVQIGGGPDRE